jgi:23S rRNA-/tRNA-specific pseudouridylate synthase
MKSRFQVVESILYADEHLVVADKPHFLPVTPPPAVRRADVAAPPDPPPR